MCAAQKLNYLKWFLFVPDKISHKNTIKNQFIPFVFFKNPREWVWQLNNCTSCIHYIDICDYLKKISLASKCGSPYFHALKYLSFCKVNSQWDSQKEIKSMKIFRLIALSNKLQIFNFFCGVENHLKKNQLLKSSFPIPSLLSGSYTDEREKNCITNSIH